MPKRVKILVSLFCILLFVYASFFRVVENKFTNWDDKVYLTSNPLIKSFNVANVKTIFSSFILDSYQPLVSLSFSLEYQFFGGNPRGYHLMSLLLHLANCMLVFWFIYTVSASVAVAGMVALFFGCHPLQVEAVAWVSERKGLLCGFFYLFSLIGYVLYLKKNNTLAKTIYLLALVCFLCALFSKATAVTLPLMLFLLDYYFKRKKGKSVLLDKIPFFALSITFSVVAVIAHYSGTRIKEPPVSLLSIGMIALESIVFYLKQTIIPFPLSALYPATEIGRVFFVALPILAVCLLIFLIQKKRFSRETIFGVSFFLITLIPMLQFIKVGKSPVADRYVYLGLIGLFYSGASWFIYTWNRANKKLIKGILVVVFVFLCGVASFLTYRRVLVWNDDFSLWNDCIRKYEISFAYNNRGEAYYTIARDYTRAFDDFNKAIELNSLDAPAYANRASVYFIKKDYDSAIADYARALSINPKISNVHYWQGVAYLKKEEYLKAIAIFSEAIRIHPQFLEAYQQRGFCYLSVKDYALAVSDFSKVIQNRPFLAEAYMNRSMAYKNLNEEKLANDDFAKAKILGGKTGNRVLEMLRSINEGK